MKHVVLIIIKSVSIGLVVPDSVYFVFRHFTPFLKGVKIIMEKMTFLDFCCTVFNEHKECLLRRGVHGPAIVEGFKEQCPDNPISNSSGCP